MGYLRYKGYTGSVEFSDEDNCLYGKVQGLKKTLISYEGRTIDEIRDDFESAVDCYLESCAQRGVEPAKPFNGKFVVRMSSEMHTRIAEIAALTGTTINDFVNRAIAHEINSIAGSSSVVACEPGEKYGDC